ncbi:MAG TPA: translation initiation factor IF-2 [Desulfarculaceae bacterium]|nr:translation initiation factor IF-2 [Desulfarculaceae bacterium]
MREKKKTKVYELSRVLKLKEAELITILESLEIEVSTKFSSISDENVARVKAWCAQYQGPDVVEKRVGSTVRRRRRKVVKPVEPEVTEVVAEESTGTSDEAQEATADTVAPVADTVVEPETVAETDSQDMAPAVDEVADAAVSDEVPVVPEPESAVVAEVEAVVAEEGESKGETDAPDEASEVEVAATEIVIEEKPTTTGKKKKTVKEDRGARVIGRVALSDLGSRPASRVVRGKAKRKESAPASGERQDPKVQPSAPVADDNAKKGRKSRKKDGAPDTDKSLNEIGKRPRKGSRRSVIKDFNFSDGRGKGRKGKGSRKKGGQKTEITMPKMIKRVVKITDAITVGELAKKMGVKAGEIITKLMGMGSMVTINQMIDFDTATLVAEEYGHTVENVAFDEELVLKRTEDIPEDMVRRPPVVTIMGHVDHGKTSLLDAIREARVAEGEAGGITQHIGAYMVSLEKGDISFVDTPGHEAFTSMRSRGAGVTDIVILVVAADDGVMPTTIESINHAKAAEVPIIVAINKIDKDNARPDEVRRQLSEHGLQSEDWGGDTIFVEVSAKLQQNLDSLLEMVLLQAEMMEIVANPNKAASGVVLESRLDRGKGPIATVLVQEGTVKSGDFVVAGLYSGRVRALLDDKGRQIESAGPSIPVEILGLSGVPSAGDDFNVVQSEKKAKELTSNRQHKAREKDISKTSKISLEDLFEQMEEGTVEQLNVIVKGDVQGSVEAVSESLKKQATSKVKVDVVHAAVGGVKEADVMLAAASQAIIVAFNVRPDLKAQHLAERENVDIRLYSVIYDLLDDLKKAMEGLLAPDIREVYLGRAEVREAFNVSKVGTIAGCRVIDGKVKRNADIRLLRDDVVIVEGKISSLKRFKDDAKEVASGFECGIGIENYNDIKAGDVIEAFVMEEVAAKL